MRPLPPIVVPSLMVLPSPRALRYGRTDVCRWLLAQGLGDTINERDEYGDTPVVRRTCVCLCVCVCRSGVSQPAPPHVRIHSFLITPPPGKSSVPPFRHLHLFALVCWFG